MKARYKILLTACILLAFLAALATSCHNNSDSTPTPTATPTPTPTTDLAELQSLKNREPATVDNYTLPISSIEDLHITGSPPDIDTEQYRLVVDGLVEQPLSLTYSEFLSRPSVTNVVLLICPGVFVDNAEWTGVPVSLLLEEAGVDPEAEAIAFYSADGYQKTVSLEGADMDGVFLAHHVNGEVLPLKHGYPLRLVVEGQYGYIWVKWVNHIQVL